VAETGDRADWRLAELVALGIVTKGSEAPLKRFKPVRVKGRTVSETLLEDREERI
jgi:hypothetical protein